MGSSKATGWKPNTKLKCPLCNTKGGIIVHESSKGDLDRTFCTHCGKYLVRYAGKWHRYFEPEFDNRGNFIKANEPIDISKGKGR